MVKNVCDMLLKEYAQAVMEILKLHDFHVLNRQVVLPTVALFYFFNTALLAICNIEMNPKSSHFQIAYSVTCLFDEM